jgi:hypothetical protein
MCCGGAPRKVHRQIPGNPVLGFRVSGFGFRVLLGRSIGGFRGTLISGMVPKGGHEQVLRCGKKQGRNNAESAQTSG